MRATWEAAAWLDVSDSAVRTGRISRDLIELLIGSVVGEKTAMGTDIHAIFQKRDGDKWVDVESTWDQDRHYFLFSWLADVRNGYGFAGVKIYEPLKPIIPERRGLPADFDVDGDDHPTTMEGYCPRRRKYLEESEKANLKYWMGDHSYSWLTADEILAAPRPRGALHTGIVPRAFYDSWDRKTPPKTWSGGITGPDVVVDEAPSVRPEATHVKISWAAEDDGLDYFVGEIARLKSLHGEVRMVFGFDS